MFPLITSSITSSRLKSIFFLNPVGINLSGVCIQPVCIGVYKVYGYFDVYFVEAKLIYSLKEHKKSKYI